MAAPRSLTGLLAGLFLVPALVVLGWTTSSPASADDAYTPTALPGPANPEALYVDDVDCWSTGNCAAVGHMSVSGSPNPRPVVYQETDGDWGDAIFPTGTGQLASVSCPSTGFCVAVGDNGGPGSGSSGLLATLSGGTWTTSTTGLSDGYDESLVDVSCASSTSCAAVGYSYTSGGPERALAARFAAGTWTATQVVPPDLRAGVPATRASLVSVSCYAPGTCVAAGRSESESGERAGTFSRLGGGTWTSENAPKPSDADGSFNQLFSISCASTGRCAAAGEYYQSGGPPYVLSAMVLDRTTSGTWSATKVPLPATTDQVRVSAASCTDDGTCAVVGTANVPYDPQLPSRPSGAFPIVLTSDGGGWTTSSVTLPHPVGAGWGQVSALLAVSCVSAERCTGVGYYGTDRNDDGTPEAGYEGLVVDVDPTARTVTAQDAPLPADGEAATGYEDVPLTGVRCLDADHCTIVGTYVYDEPDGDDATNGLALDQGGSVQPPDAPTITSISPAKGPKKGGTKVSVTGTGFIDVVNVTFGSAKGTKVTVIDDETLTVKTPKHKPGTVPVKVKTAAGKGGGATFRYR